MTSTVRTLVLLGLVASALASCKTPEDPAGSPTQVSWPRAVELVNSGRVEQAFQSHALVVHLVLKDGSTFQTTEPNIDDIMRVIKECGSKCSEILFATE
jgi:hypothetical protein